MKIRPANWFWLIFLALVVGGFVYALIPPPPDTNGQRLFAETRDLLRQQGFKAGLADFNFSTPPDTRAREYLLQATARVRTGPPPAEPTDLMEMAGTNSAIVVWKQDSLKRTDHPWAHEGNELTWDEFRAALTGNDSEVDAACEAVLAGPIAFNLDASRGGAMLLPHLAVLKNLTQELAGRTVLALHGGDEGAAFTNLLAATRLVTAWQVEPVEISHLVRFADVKIVFAATWQALQTNHWPDEQLGRLQAEWESVNFFTNLPDIVAFQRASRIAAYDYDRNEALHPSVPFPEFLRETWANPLNAWYQLKNQWRQRAYLHGGRYEEERDVMLFYRDREIECRHAVRAATWMQMRQFPGVTNEMPFPSKYSSRVQAMENLRQMTLASQRLGSSFLGRVAEAEAERRILIAALALERYRGTHGAYPNSLAALAPEFLPAVPVDFMDGQPLRYRLTEGGHFLLYSVGPDCTDDGGTAIALPRTDPAGIPSEWRTVPPKGDLLWPVPASAADAAAVRQKEKRAGELQNLNAQDRESEEDWRQSPLRLARVQKILTMNWSPDTNMENFAGRRVVDLAGNEKNPGTNPPLLGELLTPRPIPAGGEPENLTFDVPVRYDAITNLGALVLLVDADPEEPMGDSGGRIQDCQRAGNGDCLLVWHTIFDPPGEHAVQVQLVLSSQRGGEYLLKGPAIPVVTTNLCQFSLNSATYDLERGAIFHARLPEQNGLYAIECVTTNGEHLKTIPGSTSNGEFNVVWNLVDDYGRRLSGETFDSLVHITLPDSGRSQTLKGP